MAKVSQKLDPKTIKAKAKPSETPFKLSQQDVLHAHLDCCEQLIAGFNAFLHRALPDQRCS